MNSESLSRQQQGIFFCMDYDEYELSKNHSKKSLTFFASNCFICCLKWSLNFAVFLWTTSVDNSKRKSQIAHPYNSLPSTQNKPLTLILLLTFRSRAYLYCYQSNQKWSEGVCLIDPSYSYDNESNVNFSNFKFFLIFWDLNFSEKMNEWMDHFVPCL